MTISMDKELKVDTSVYRIGDIRQLTDSACVISLKGRNFSFRAGQHISVAIHGDFQHREYSVYSGTDDENLEILVKEVEGGYFTSRLKFLNRGDLLHVRGPFGKFGLDLKKFHSHRHVFIASGTGIAPFHSIVRSYGGLNYTLIHGVRYGSEAYERESYDKSAYVLCTSGDDSGNYHGRVTGYLRDTAFESNTAFYLCGNSEMIFDSMEILKQKGFTREDFNVEVYF